MKGTPQNYGAILAIIEMGTATDSGGAVQGDRGDTLVPLAG